MNRKIARRVPSDTLQNMRELVLLWRQMKVDPRAFFLLVLWSFLAVVFNVIGVWLLIPLAAGVVEMDFSTAGSRVWFLQAITGLLPEVIDTGPSVIACCLYAASLAFAVQPVNTRANASDDKGRLREEKISLKVSGLFVSSACIAGVTV